MEFPATDAIQAFHTVLAQSGDDAGAAWNGGQDLDLRPVELFHLAHDAQGFTHHGTGHDQVDVGSFHFGHLGGKIDVTHFVGRFGRHSETTTLEGLGDATSNQIPKRTFLVNDAHFLGFPVVHGPGQRRGGGGVVVHDGGEQQRAVAADLLDDARCTPWGKDHDACVVGEFDCGCIGAGAKGVDDGKNVVALDQLLHGPHRQLGLAPVVFHNEFDLAPVNPTSGVEFVNAQLHAVAQHGHAGGGWARQVDVGANHDFGIAHPLGGLGLHPAGQ